MERPKWVTSVGIVGIVFACLDIIWGILFILTPLLIQYVDTIKQQRQENVVAATNDEHQETQSPSDSTSPLKDVPWYIPSFIVRGVAAICIGIFFLIASILFLKLKSYAPVVFCIALIWEIILEVVGFGVSITARAAVDYEDYGGIIFRVGIILALIVIVLVFDKTAFRLPRMVKIKRA